MTSVCLPPTPPVAYRSFSLDVEHHVAHRMSSVDRGRCLVLTTIVITLLGNLLFVVLPAASDSIPFFAGTILAFCAVAALLYAMWRGQPWARWLLVALYVVGLALRLTLIFRWPDVLDIARATQQFVAALLLAAPPSVGAFLATQRNPHADI
jgi:nicotinamide riboside transporter PnuC